MLLKLLAAFGVAKIDHHLRRQPCSGQAIFALFDMRCTDGIIDAIFETNRARLVGSQLTVHLRFGRAGADAPQLSGLPDTVG